MFGMSFNPQPHCRYRERKLQMVQHHQPVSRRPIIDVIEVKINHVEDLIKNMPHNETTPQLRAFLAFVWGLDSAVC